jgi:hypothetical protein
VSHECEKIDLVHGTRRKGRLQPKYACPMKQQTRMLCMGHAENTEMDLQAKNNVSMKVMIVSAKHATYKFS